MARRDISKRESKKPKKSSKQNNQVTPIITNPQVERVQKRKKGRDDDE